ncbi:helix-turn-helix domain-containing protein [Gemmiger sp.]
METAQQAVAFRIRQLCQEHGLTPNGISIRAGVPQATVKSILNGESKNPGISTIKKLCDGFGITLGEFFSTPEFDMLEQEIY